MLQRTILERSDTIPNLDNKWNESTLDNSTGQERNMQTTLIYMYLHLSYKKRVDLPRSNDYNKLTNFLAFFFLLCIVALCISPTTPNTFMNGPRIDYISWLPCRLVGLRTNAHDPRHS